MYIPLISPAFGWLFKLFYNLTQHQYLLTLLLFAIVVKLVLFPFGVKQQKNSLKQARVRPKEMAIRRKYAGRNDRATQQKMSEEIMRLYQEENVNPMGGCLPLLIQMPVLFALYDVIRNPLTYILGYKKDVIEALCKVVDFQTKGVDQIKLIDELVKKGFSIKGADFEAVKALKDSFDFFGFDLTVKPGDVWGIYIIIPLLTFVFSFLSSKLIRKFSYQPQMQQDASTKASMTMMDWMMPLMSVWISVILSSAIGIYWMFQNILSVLQQMLLYKMYPIPAVTEEQIKEAELQLKGKSKQNKSKEAVYADYEIDDYDKTDKKAEAEQAKKSKETDISTRKAGISPKVKKLVAEGKTLKARKKI